jgi:hypothetical protein
LIAAGRGVPLGEPTFVARPTARKVREATASLALQRGNDLLHGAIAEREVAFGEAERLARQLLAVAQAKGLLGADDGRPHQQRLTEVDRRIATDPDLASGYVHLVALVGKTDVLIFLDRALSGLE